MIREFASSFHPHASKSEAMLILNSYLGKNTPQRNDHLMERLVVPVKEWTRVLQPAGSKDTFAA